jgi:hypothetical protein
MNDCSEKNPHLQILQEKTTIRWQEDKKNHPLAIRILPLVGVTPA